MTKIIQLIDNVHTTIEFNLGERLHPEATDGDDREWIRSLCRVKTPHFTAQIPGNSCISEWKNFITDCEELYKTLKGEAHFYTLEDWLRINMQCDALGQVETEIHLLQECETLQLQVAFDQTHIHHLIEEIKSHLKTYD